MGKLPRLTVRERDALESILCYREDHGFMPAVREIGLMLELSDKAPHWPHQILEKLEEKGYIRRSRHQSRAITVLALPE